MAYAVELKKITKCFPGVIANKDVSLSVNWGSIHGLIGENGAGKTTLMKILYGMYHQDSGDIFIDGKKVRLKSPSDAIKLGIGMVHQHFTLVPSLTVAQNIILGKPICKKNGLIDIEKANAVVEQLGREYRLLVDPKAIVKNLPVAMRQRVEILKALYLGADILIMDEPTAVLTPQEITELLHTLKLLKEKGKSIILITHKLKELMDATDEITVLRAGQVTGRVKTKDANERIIAAMMVGREISFDVDKGPSTPGDEVLKLSHVSFESSMGVKALNDVCFSVRRGEIVGVAGVQGNGQTELIDVISGMENHYDGEILLNGEQIPNTMPPIGRRKIGLSHIPEDRQTIGSALGADLLDNFIMGDLENSQYTSKWTIKYKAAAIEASEQFAKFNVKYASLSEPAGALSGGNLQKAITAREMYRNKELLIAAQPSRGVDIGATIFIHEKLIEMRDSGKAILLISSELSEIMSLSDRIIVMYNGSIVGEVLPSETTEEEIGLMMAGIRKENQQ